MSEKKQPINTGKKSDEEAQRLINESFKKFVPPQPGEPIVPPEIVEQNNKGELKRKLEELEEASKKK